MPKQQSSQVLVNQALNDLIKKTEEIDAKKIPGLLKMIAACLEFIDDPALIHPISFSSYADRTQEFLGYCRGLLLQKNKWANILNSLDFIKEGRVCELCPGMASKCLWGLSKTAFHGEAFIWDASEIAVSDLEMLNDFLCLPFKVNTIKDNLFIGKQDPFDLILANHILDDLILDYLSKGTNSLHNEEEEAVLMRINEALKQLEAFPELGNRFAVDLASIICGHLKQNGLFVWCEYSPLFYRSRSLELWEKQLKRIRDFLGDELVSNGLKKLPHIEAFVFRKC